MCSEFGRCGLWLTLDPSVIKFPPLFEFQEKKKVTLLDTGNMEDAGHSYAVFSSDSHTQTKHSDLLQCN